MRVYPRDGQCPCKRVSSLPCEDTNQEEGLHQEPNGARTLTLDFQTPEFQKTPEK